MLSDSPTTKPSSNLLAVWHEAWRQENAARRYADERCKVLEAEVARLTAANRRLVQVFNNEIDE